MHVLLSVHILYRCLPATGLGAANQTPLDGLHPDPANKLARGFEFAPGQWPTCQQMRCRPPDGGPRAHHAARLRARGSSLGPPDGVGRFRD